MFFTTSTYLSSAYQYACKYRKTRQRLFQFRQSPETFERSILFADNNFPFLLIACVLINCQRRICSELECKAFSRFFFSIIAIASFILVTNSFGSFYSCKHHIANSPVHAEIKFFKTIERVLANFQKNTF